MKLLAREEMSWRAAAALVARLKEHTHACGVQHVPTGERGEAAARYMVMTRRHGDFVRASAVMPMESDPVHEVVKAGARSPS